MAKSTVPSVMNLISFGWYSTTFWFYRWERIVTAFANACPRSPLSQVERLCGPWMAAVSVPKAPMAGTSSAHVERLCRPFMEVRGLQGQRFAMLYIIRYRSIKMHFHSTERRVGKTHFHSI